MTATAQLYPIGWYLTDRNKLRHIYFLRLGNEYTVVLGGF